MRRKQLEETTDVGCDTRSERTGECGFLLAAVGIFVAGDDGTFHGIEFETKEAVVPSQFVECVLHLVLRVLDFEIGLTQRRVGCPELLVDEAELLVALAELLEFAEDVDEELVRLVVIERAVIVQHEIVRRR